MTTFENLTIEEASTGNIVRLRSGGPLMTVGGFNAGQLVCFWMSNDNMKLCRENFYPETLYLLNQKIVEKSETPDSQ